GLTGWVYRPWLTFFVDVELAGNPPFLLDAYVDVAAWETLTGRVGQFKTPFSRAEQYGPEAELVPDQPGVAGYFWTGRGKGGMASGALDSLHYAVGAFGGSPIRQPTTISGNYLVEARATLGDIPLTEYAYNEPPGVSASLEGYVGKIEEAIEAFDPSSFAF